MILIFSITDVFIKWLYQLLEIFRLGMGTCTATSTCSYTYWQTSLPKVGFHFIQVLILERVSTFSCTLIRFKIKTISIRFYLKVLFVNWKWCKSLVNVGHKHFKILLYMVYIMGVLHWTSTFCPNKYMYHLDDSFKVCCIST